MLCSYELNDVLLMNVNNQLLFYSRWYNKHLKEFGKSEDDNRISIVLLTNDAKNKEKAMEEGIEVYTGLRNFSKISIILLILHCVSKKIKPK